MSKSGLFLIHMKSLLAVCFVAVLVFISCKKDSFITSGDARLSVSADTLHFDTVFTTTGSVTQLFIIHNDNDQKLRLSGVALSGGDASAFKMNVDGTAGSAISDVELDANDSIYVFVTVKVDPTAADLPFVIRDSIRVGYNGNERWIQLEAWGQNANFMRSRLLTADETWTSNKPYVILGGLRVDTGVTLTIEKGCRVYFHADAPFIVDGTLQVNGEKEDANRVVFRGDRLDDPYRDFPGGWPGIFFRGESKDNVLQFATVQNAFQGIVVEEPTVNVNPKVTLQECIIDNCYDAGIIGLQSDISARNCLISNNGKNMQLVRGGNYDFVHCTSVAYSNPYISHKDPVLVITDFVKENNNFLVADLSANFTNCIFWGSDGTVDDEVVTDKKGTNFIANFQNCLWKYKTEPLYTSSFNMIVNTDPMFDSVNTARRFFNFRLKDVSPALNMGVATAVSIDLDGNPRAIGLPDLGCYEKQ